MRGKANHLKWLLCMLFVLAARQKVFAHNPLPEPSGPPKIIYVDADAVGANDGSSWADAFNYLRDALTTASPGDEIRVAEGIYKPNQGILPLPGRERPPWTPGEEGQSATFELKQGVTVKGGFAGFGAAEPNMYDPGIYETILSGDLDNNDTDVDGTWSLADDPTRADNSEHIITSIADDESTVIDGFIVTGGKSRGNGGGMLIRYGSPTILNCVFEHNSSRGGGAIYIELGQSLLRCCKFIENLSEKDGGALCGVDLNLTLSECSFIGNWANDVAGGALIFGDAVFTGCEFRNNTSQNGGGIAHSAGELEQGKLELIDCAFFGNLATLLSSNKHEHYGYGGAVWTSEAIARNCIFNANWASDGGVIFGNVQSIENCIFTGNTAERGGCLYETGNTIITSCVFAGNRAKDGGVLYTTGYGPSLIGCTLSDNSAWNGNAVAWGQYSHVPAFLRMTFCNCILWDEGDEIGKWEDELPDISIVFSDVQGGWPGEGNIDLDPCFAEPGYWDPNGTPDDPNNDLWIEGNYHLKSQAGRWDPVTESWIVDDVTSPCIDAGDPNSPIGYEPFPNGIINMGAYGGTPEASKSPSGIHAKYGGGTGEPNNPYLIYTHEQMNIIGQNEQDRDKHFKLMADIDLDPNLPERKVYDEAVIGNFKGVFDGNGHTISHFSYTSSNGFSIGLFRQISGQNALIKDLGLIAPIINTEEGSHVGSLVGQVSSGTIINCYVNGGSVLGEELVGGLVGLNHGNINNCYSTCSVTGKDDVGGLVGLNSSTTITNCYAGGEVFGRDNVGGLVGWNSGGTIKNSSATGSVTGEKRNINSRENRGIGGLIGDNSGPLIGCSAASDVSGDTQVGGLVGKNSDSIINSYATGSVLGTEYVGGLVGYNSISIINCYSTGGVSGTTYVGGLVGQKGFAGTVLNSFWDIQTSGQLISDGGISRSTAEMQTADTFLFAGWDFVDETTNGTEDIWWILEGQDYPQLWWEASENELLDN